ncbi:MAG: hypothetical protein ACFB22_08565 [Rhodothalassiaceae bacterium]
MGPGYAVTLAGLVAGIGLTALGAWRTGKPYEPGRLGWVPWPLVMMLGVVLILVMIGHLITLTTGVHFEGRRR